MFLHLLRQRITQLRVIGPARVERFLGLSKTNSSGSELLTFTAHLSGRREPPLPQCDRPLFASRAPNAIRIAKWPSEAVRRGDLRPCDVHFSVTTAIAKTQDWKVPVGLVRSKTHMDGQITSSMWFPFKIHYWESGHATMMCFQMESFDSEFYFLHSFAPSSSKRNRDRPFPGFDSLENKIAVRQVPKLLITTNSV